MIIQIDTSFFERWVIAVGVEGFALIYFCLVIYLLADMIQHKLKMDKLKSNRKRYYE